MPLIFLDPYPRNEAMVFTDDTREALESLGDLVVHFGSRAPDALVEDILPRVDVIVGQTAMPRERIDRAPNLKAILNVKANWEPNIDYAHAQGRGIYVLSSAPVMGMAVAEMALGHAIGLGRGITAGDRAFRAGTERYSIDGNGRAYSLHGAEVGLIGFGNLARDLVPLLAPFRARISVYDPWLSPEYLSRFGVAAAPLDEVLEKSRFLFILAGATSENEGFLDRAKLQQITPDASVMLISRAEVVDFDAFVELADSGHFRAAIDVYPEEPAPADVPVRTSRNTVLTSHLAGGIHDSYRRMREWMVDDIRQVLAGHPPLMMQRAEPRQALLGRSR